MKTAIYEICAICSNQFDVMIGGTRNNYYIWTCDECHSAAFMLQFEGVTA
jgi:hypothetical protein